MSFGQLLHTDLYNISLIKYLLFVVILFNALVSSLTIRAADGGHMGNSYLHFVVLTWLGCLTAYTTNTLINAMLQVDV